MGVSTFMIHRLILLSPELSNDAGHQKEYVSLLADAAGTCGLETLAVTGPRGAELLPGIAVDERLPAFEPPAPTRGLVARVRRKLEAVRQARHRSEVYRHLFETRRAGDLTFLHTAPYPEIGVILDAWPGDGAGRLAVMLRSDHDDDPARMAQIRRALRGAAKPGVSILADTADLAQALGPLAPRPVQVAPAPWSGATNTVARFPGRVGVFGARRRHKGYLRLPGLVQAARRREAGLHFVVHGYPHRELRDDPELDQAGEALRGLGVEVIEEILPSADMQAHVAACAAILLPYDRHIYRYGSSGMFVQAVASGCGVVVPTGTWMQAEAARSGLERVFDVDIDDSDATVTALVEAARIGAQPHRPGAAEAAWIEGHTPHGLLTRLLDASRHD